MFGGYFYGAPWLFIQRNIITGTQAQKEHFWAFGHKCCELTTI